MRLRRTVLLAGALVPLLALGACGGGDPAPSAVVGRTPSVTPSVSPSVTPSVSPSEVDATPAVREGPTMPAAARGKDAAAAEAFVRFYWEMVDYAQATGDVSGLRSLGRKCVACDNGMRWIASVYERGGDIRGGSGRTRVFLTGFIWRDGESWAVVECQVVSTKQVVDLPGTDDDETYPGGPTDLRMILEPTRTSWVVRSLVKR